MPAAHFIVVERESPDVFVLTWWDFQGRKIEERETPATLTRRIGVLTMPGEGTGIPKMGMTGPRC